MSAAYVCIYRGEVGTAREGFQGSLGVGNLKELGIRVRQR